MDQASTAPGNHALAGLAFAFILAATRKDLVNEAEFLGLVRRHEVVAVEGLFNLVIGAAGVVHIDLVQPALDLLDVRRMPLDVRGLAAETAGGWCTMIRAFGVA